MVPRIGIHLRSLVPLPLASRILVSGDVGVGVVTGREVVGVHFSVASGIVAGTRERSWVGVRLTSRRR